MEDYCYIKLQSKEEYFNPYHSQWNKCGDYFNLDDFAPDFTLDSIFKGEDKKISLSDYKGKWVILFFYGSDFSFV